MIKSYIILGLVILAVIILVISLIKKAVKLVLLILAIFIGIGVYNVVVNGRSPAQVFNDYVMNIKYGRDVAKLTGEINTSAGNIKKVIEGKNIDKASADTLKKENENLHKYQDEFKLLKHTPGFDSFHNNYANYLNSIVAISDNTVKLADSGTMGDAQDMLNKIKNNLDNLINLKL